MSQIKNFIFIVFILISITAFAQKAIDEDPELVQNNINYRIAQSQTELENFNYYKAKVNLDEALEIADKADNKKILGIIYAKKGRLELIFEELDKAIKSLNKAIEIQRIINDNVNLGSSYKTFGDIYLAKEDYYSALDSYTAAKSKFEEEDLNEELAETLLCEGKTCYQLKNYKKARDVVEQSLAIAKKYDYLKIQSDALINHAKIYDKLRNKEKALEVALSGLQIARTNSFTNILNEGYEVTSNLYFGLEEHKLSRNYLNAHLKLSDSIRGLTRINSSRNQDTQFRLNEEIEKNKEVVQKLEKAEDDKNLGTLISILSVALITILSLLTLSLYKNNNIRLKTNNMLHKKNGELIIAKEKAELASKTKANFLSTVTHELRTPLYAVTGISNMLLDENPKPEQVQHLKSLKFSGDYLLTFINDILQINKIEANKVDIEPESFNLKKKINNIVLALANSAQDNNVKIHFEFDKDLPQNFIADQLKISQILINLIGNSIKFTKDGDIWIRVYKIEEEGKTYTLRFEVEDNGIGISQEKQDHMFESFSQGSIQINRKYGGTGLGLSIVKGLIDILKGKIYVKSELEKGTAFYFEIPLEYTNIKEAEEKKVTYFEGNASDLDLSQVKILIVEDNKINQMITKKILTKMNLKCDIVDNGEDAVELIKNNNYNIILMDIHMPGISGIEATKIIRSFDKKLTIFALTAVTIEDKMHEFEEAGFTDIIPKPFKQEEFEKKLYNALAGKSQSS
ncbi:ATP-binding protein [uncultured Algibacter sp.]|jgi:signal transduction histidine kinase/CheY-like chemotaxis protein|uniref:tetratricopeptide repeat-containing hybrid sensor histidine kinase/response regulator n=1 Tax=uncultured Algibacter sp. TaxID=298659 RepID=UPI0025E6F858|nr:ATP-binding protein [uncultured Algibacter sp.]MDC1197757.1 ATP-binding protein [Algibacter sp.]